MNEAFENSVGTQRADIKNYKKFILNLTNIALPNLVAFDLVMVKPMTSRSGFVTYVEYVAGSTKGGINKGDVFNSSLGFHNSFGKLDEARVNYTGATVVETVKEAGKVKWNVGGGHIGCYDADGKFQEGKVMKADGSIVAVAAVAVGDEVTYIYDNTYIPQADLPIINAVTKDIPLIAKPRRIAIYYSQMAAYEMKMEMGEDLGQNLSEQAVSELKWEIDNEVILFLKNLAGAAKFEFNKSIPVGISMAQHYEGFKGVLNAVRSEIYNRTGRFAPNYMVCAVDVLEVLGFVNGFRASAPRAIAGPYLAGTVDGLKVVVSPALAAGEFFMGVNDGMVSAAVSLLAA